MAESTRIGGAACGLATAPRSTLADTEPTAQSVLFLCTGNYYRSRFAEILFNHVAARQGLPWRAVSRGLDVDGVTNPGPISRYAVEGLKARGIVPQNGPRDPMQVSVRDLEEADLIVAVKEAEHRPMVARQFPEWTERVEYWHIDDLDFAEAEDALAELDAHVAALVARLATASGAGPRRGSS